MRIWTRWVVTMVLLGGAAVALADSNGPPTRRTGATAVAAVAAEGDCTGCHGGNSLNSGGSVQILNAPDTYTPGASYDITLRVTSTNTSGDAGRGWGVEATAVRLTDGAGSGTWTAIAGQGTSIASGTVSGVTRSYIRQTDARFGVASPVDFVVRWTAPTPGVGSITLFAVGLAADGDGNESNDWLYTASKTLVDLTTPASTVTWGQVKRRYR